MYIYYHHILQRPKDQVTELFYHISGIPQKFYRSRIARYQTKLGPKKTLVNTNTIMTHCHPREPRNQCTDNVFPKNICKSCASPVYEQQDWHMVLIFRTCCIRFPGTVRHQTYRLAVDLHRLFGRYQDIFPAVDDPGFQKVAVLRRDTDRCLGSF